MCTVTHAILSSAEGQRMLQTRIYGVHTQNGKYLQINLSRKVFAEALKPLYIHIGQNDCDTKIRHCI